MNKYTEYHQNNPAERDYIFYEVLKKFNNEPINILEIGTARNLDPAAKHGDGVSIIFWGQYARLTNSKITVVELDPQALANCKIISEDFKDYITYINGDGLKYLDENNDYDLVYLDAGDSPSLTLEMFEKCDRNKNWIFVDDANGPGGKADLLRPAHQDYILYNCKGCSHEMILYPRLSNIK